MTSDELERARAADGCLCENRRPFSTIWCGRHGTTRTRALICHDVDLSLIGAMSRAAIEGR